MKIVSATLVCVLTSLVVASCTRHDDLIVSQVIEKAKQAMDMPSGTAIVVVQRDDRHHNIHALLTQMTKARFVDSWIVVTATYHVVVYEVRIGIEVMF